MATVADIPRDVQLAIIKKFDIDTRIKTNMILKLRVPQDIKDRLSHVCRLPCIEHWPDACVMSYKILGQRQAPGGAIYTIRCLEHSGDQASHEVAHVESNGYLVRYALINQSWQLVPRMG